MEIDSDKFIKLTSWEEHDFGLVFEWEYCYVKKATRRCGDELVEFLTCEEFKDWVDRHDQEEFVEESFVDSGK